MSCINRVSGDFYSSNILTKIPMNRNQEKINEQAADVTDKHLTYINAIELNNVAQQQEGDIKHESTVHGHF